MSDTRTIDGRPRGVPSSSPPTILLNSSSSTSSSTAANVTSSLPSAAAVPTTGSVDPPHRTTSFHYISRSLIAGGLAGCLAKTAVAPLDRVKILFQGANSSVSHLSGTIFGSFRAVQWIAQKEGLRAVYKGHQATLLRIFPYAALNYMCYEQYKRILRKQKLYPITSTSANDLPPVIRLIAGSAAGLTSVFFTYPLDYVHSRITYQVKMTRYKGVIDTIQLTLQESGVKGLYRGFGATALGIIPYAGCSFFTYDTLKHFASDYYTKQAALEAAASSSSPPSHVEVPVGVRLLCGALAGAAAQTASYPFDVVRRRMQLYGLSSHLPKYRNTWHAVTHIVQTEGIKRLYIGLSINFFKVGPAVSAEAGAASVVAIGWILISFSSPHLPPQHAISFVSYEYFKKQFNIK